MGFLDKAKKLAEEAQAKADELQKNFNEKQAQGTGTPGTPPVEYDQHGRVIPPATPATPGAPPSPPTASPVGDAPLAPPAPPAPPMGGAPVPTPSSHPGLSIPAPAPSQPPSSAPPTAGPPPAAPTPPAGDVKRPEEDYEPPKLSGGDPLTG